MKEDQTFPNNLIKIGQNAAENDELVKDSKQTDYWFHLDNLSSCHVVIASDKKNSITKRMINHCAVVCKENTKYKNQKVKVKYTKIKNVKRTEIPGRVTLKGKNKVIIV
jgi:predicted ribosome quality control (RQC) complex YloA/Tae2 family protein